MLDARVNRCGRCRQERRTHLDLCSSTGVHKGSVRTVRLIHKFLLLFDLSWLCSAQYKT